MEKPVVWVVALGLLCLGAGCAGSHHQPTDYDQIRQRAEMEQTDLDAATAETESEEEWDERRDGSAGEAVQE